MNKINYFELGGSLFVPATHKNIANIISGEKYPTLKSVVIDTEDGISSDDLDKALSTLKNILLDYKKRELFVFVRPKNIKVLQKILLLEGIEKIDGFVLPKFSLLNAVEYFNTLKPYDFSLMPSIEGRELFNHNELHKLKDIILTNADKIVLVRYGLEDMLKQLRIKRSCDDSIFDFSSTSSVIGNFIATFKSAGFGVSGGVYPCFENMDGFVRDVKRDLKEGLFSKTIIHPSQIDLINDIYRVTQKEFDDALEICKRRDGVFNLHGTMAESITMIPSAQETIQRAEVYGIREEV